MNTVAELIRLKGHRVRSIQKSASVAEAAKAFLDHEVSSLLVYDGDQLAGIFTKNDLVRRLVDEPNCFCDRSVAEGMTAELFTTTPDADLEEVFAHMVRRGIRHVPVLDGNRAVGMVTSIDILLQQKTAMRCENEQLIRYIYGYY